MFLSAVAVWRASRWTASFDGLRLDGARARRLDRLDSDRSRAVAVAVGLIIVLREIVGLVRLGRLSRLKRDTETALRTKDVALERKAVAALAETFRGRRDLSWSLAKLRDHARRRARCGRSPAARRPRGDGAVDAPARRLVLRSATQAGGLPPASPMVWIACC